MDLLLELLPAHIVIGLSISIVLVFAEVIDIEDLFMKWNKKKNSYLDRRDRFFSGSLFFKEEVEQENRKKAGLVDQIKCIRLRATIFFLLFSVLCLNVDVLTILIFKIQLSSLQNAIIGFIPAVIVTLYAEEFIRHITRP